MLSSNEKIKFRILTCVFLGMIPVLLYIIGGLYYVQIVRHEDYLLVAKKTYTATLKREHTQSKLSACFMWFQDCLEDSSEFTLE